LFCVTLCSVNPETAGHLVVERHDDLVVAEEESVTG
jgi:hypothetical protein